MAKIKAVCNLARTEWWPLSAIGRFKIIAPAYSGSPNWRVVAQYKTDQQWMAVFETSLMKDAQDWIEETLN
jgi:hypothetical protein